MEIKCELKNEDFFNDKTWIDYSKIYGHAFDDYDYLDWKLNGWSSGTDISILLCDLWFKSEDWKSEMNEKEKKFDILIKSLGFYFNDKKEWNESIMKKARGCLIKRILYEIEMMINETDDKTKVNLIEPWIVSVILPEGWNDEIWLNDLFYLRGLLKLMDGFSEKNTFELIQNRIEYFSNLVSKIEECLSGPVSDNFGYRILDFQKGLRWIENEHFQNWMEKKKQRIKTKLEEFVVCLFHYFKISLKLKHYELGECFNEFVKLWINYELEYLKTKNDSLSQDKFLKISNWFQNNQKNNNSNNDSISNHIFNFAIRPYVFSRFFPNVKSIEILKKKYQRKLNFYGTLRKKNQGVGEKLTESQFISCLLFDISCMKNSSSIAFKENYSKSWLANPAYIIPDTDKLTIYYPLHLFVLRDWIYGHIEWKRNRINYLELLPPLEGIPKRFFPHKSHFDVSSMYFIFDDNEILLDKDGMENYIIQWNEYYNFILCLSNLSENYKPKWIIPNLIQGKTFNSLIQKNYPSNEIIKTNEIRNELFIEKSETIKDCPILCGFYSLENCKNNDNFGISSFFVVKLPSIDSFELRKIPIDFTQTFEKRNGIIYLDHPNSLNWNIDLSRFFHKLFYWIDKTIKQLSLPEIVKPNENIKLIEYINSIDINLIPWDYCKSLEYLKNGKLSAFEWFEICIKLNQIFKNNDKNNAKIYDKIEIKLKNENVRIESLIEFYDYCQSLDSTFKILLPIPSNRFEKDQDELYLNHIKKLGYKILEGNPDIILWRENYWIKMINDFYEFNKDPIQIQLENFNRLSLNHSLQFKFNSESCLKDKKLIEKCANYFSYLSNWEKFLFNLPSKQESNNNNKNNDLSCILKNNLICKKIPPLLYEITNEDKLQFIYKEILDRLSLYKFTDKHSSIHIFPISDLHLYRLEKEYKESKINSDLNEENIELTKTIELERNYFEQFLDRLKNLQMLNNDQNDFHTLENMGKLQLMEMNPELLKKKVFYLLNLSKFQFFKQQKIQSIPFIDPRSIPPLKSFQHFLSLNDLSKEIENMDQEMKKYLRLHISLLQNENSKFYHSLQQQIQKIDI